MKRILFLFLLILAMSLLLPAPASSQTAAARESTQELTPKQQRQLKKQQRCQAREAANRQAYLDALEAIKEREWVLMASTLYGPRGGSVPVSDNTNFIQFKGNTVYVQLAFNGLTGRNGLGGITVEGTPTQVTSTVDKSGNITYSFFVNGTGLSAQVVVRLSNGSNFANATVYPMMNNRKLTFSGTLVPTSQSGIFRSGFVSY